METTLVYQSNTTAEVRAAAAEVETAGADMQAFTDGTIVQVFLLTGSVAPESWSTEMPQT